MKTQRFLELTLMAGEDVGEELLEEIEHYNGIIEMQSRAGVPLPRPWT